MSRVVIKPEFDLVKMSLRLTSYLPFLGLVVTGDKNVRVLLSFISILLFKTKHDRLAAVEGIFRVQGSCSS